MRRLIVSLLLSLVTLFVSCSSAPSGISRVERALELDLSGGQILTAMDNHGGFLGDGETAVVISFNDSALEDQIKMNPLWKKLPLSDNLSTAVYGLVDVSTVYNSIIDSVVIPQISDGYYFFLDRQTNTQDDSDLLNRYSFNFTLAVYDSGSGTLYYVEEDT